MKMRIQFIKRIGALVCALVVAVSCGGVASPYYASESSCYAFDLHNQFRNSIMDYGIEYKDSLPEVSSNYKFCTKFIFYDNANVVTCLFSNSPIIVKSEYDKDWKEYYLKGYFDLDNSVLYISTDACNTWTLLEESSGGVNYSAGSYYMGSYSFKSNGELNISTPSAVILDSSYPVCCEHGDVIFGEVGDLTEVYNPALGFLNNVNIKTTWLTDKDGNVDYDSFRKTISYDLITTSEVDLSVGDYSIRVYGQLSYCKNLKDEIYDDNFPLVYFGEFDASLGKFTYNSNELYDLITQRTEDPYDAWDIFIKQISRSDNLYLQIYDNSTGECGGYLKISFYDVGGYKQSTLDIDLNEFVGGFVDKDVNSSAGSGTNYDDAELNSKPANPDAFEDMESAFNSFTSTIGVIPQVVASLFSFLPPWCLNLCSVGFGLMIAVIIYKLLRG